MWNKIASFILRNRITLMIALAIITIFMAYKATTIQMDYHYANMLSEKDSVYIQNQKFKQIFGEEANGIVIGVVDKDFFNVTHFEKIQSLCNNLKKINYVSKVLSIPQAINVRQKTIGDSINGNKREFEIYNIFSQDSIITDQNTLDSLSKLFLSLPFYKGLLYNDTSNVYLIHVTLANEIINSKERIPVVNEIEKNIAKFSKDNNIETYVSGHPFIRTKMMDLIKGELVIFIILAVVICAIILYIFFRSFKVILIAMLIVIVGVICAMGVMGILGFKITILTGMVPPLLIIIGIPNTIYLLNKYHQETKLHGNKVKALQRVITRIGNAVFLSNLTTAVGFSTFILTSSSLLVHFGIIASIGILFVFISAIILVPSIFSFLKPLDDKYTKHLNNKFVHKIIDAITNIVVKHRPKVYIAIGIILVAAVFGILQIKQTGYILDDVPEDSKIFTDLKFLEKNFKGVSPMEIAIKSRDTLKGHDFIEQIEKLSALQLAFTNYPELSRSMSVADAMKFLHQAYCKGNPEKYTLPNDPKTYETIFKRLPNGLNDNLAKSFIDSSKTTTRISMNIADIGTERMRELLPKLSNEIYKQFPIDKYEVLTTGSTIMYFTGTTYLINNLFVSLFLAIIVIGLLILGLQRSFKIVIIALIPNLIPMIVTAMLMGYLNIPIKPSTILVFSIALGISVDGTIHFLTKYRFELFNNNWNISEAVRAALRETGISMVYTYIILFFGFLIFVLSDFGGTMALGFLISMTLLFSMICNLILLPTMLLSLEKITKQMFKYKPKFIDDNDIQNNNIDIN